MSSIVRIRGTVVSDPVYGGTRIDWTAPDRRIIPLCGVAPGDDPGAGPAGSFESVSVNRTQLVADSLLYGPVGVDVTRFDRIEWRGLLFDVVSAANDWIDPDTDCPEGAVWRLRRTDG